MKVLLISNAFPNSAEPVRGIFTYQIAKALKEICDIEVVAPLPWVPPFLGKKVRSQYPHANVLSKERIGDIQVYHPRYLVIPKVLGFMHSIFMFPSLFRLIKRLEREKHFDLINAHWLFPDGVAATWVGKTLRKPVILTALGCDVNLYSTMMLRRPQISRVLRQANWITTKSNGLKKKIVEMNIPNEKVTVIPNGVDLGLLRIMEKKDVRKRLGIPEGNPVIVTVCSLDEVKGTRYLIDAFKIIRDRKTIQPILYIIGDGPLRESLSSQARLLAIEDSVFFLGKQSYADIPFWMNAADVFCLPSLREGQPNVVMEALACGIPVVASNVGAIPEIINSTNGYIWKNRDVRTLGEYLKTALNRRWDRFEIRRGVAGYTWEHCASRYHDVYSSLLANQKG